MMDLVPVQSSVVAAVGYDPATRILIVLFNSGRAYEYHGVPPEVYQRLQAADSKGRFLNQEILGVFPFKHFRGWKGLSEGQLIFGRWSKPRRFARR